MSVEQITKQAANTGLSIFDSGTFEQMGMIASKLAASSLIPLSLRTEKKNGQLVALPDEQIAANCFRIVEQAQRWQMSPFAVVDCASVVHGKLMWEGKLIAAALEATMGIRLNYSYEGEGLSRKVVVSGRFPDEAEVRTVEGDVAKWKTDQWKASDNDQRLAYRGSREWSRRHSPGVILGVYSPDEFDEKDLVDVTNGRSPILRSEPIEPSPRLEVRGEASEDLTETATAPQEDKTPPKGRQKKARHHRDAEFIDITERTGKGKTWWNIVLKIGSQTAEMTTFSETISGSMREMEKNQKIRITFTNGESGFALEDYTIIAAGNEEEGLI